MLTTIIRAYYQMQLIEFHLDDTILYLAMFVFFQIGHF